METAEVDSGSPAVETVSESQEGSSQESLEGTWGEASREGTEVGSPISGADTESEIPADAFESYQELADSGNEAGSELAAPGIKDGGGDESEIPADAFESYQELAATDNEAGSELPGLEIQDGSDEAEIPADAFESYQELAATADNEAGSELPGPEIQDGSDESEIPADAFESYQELAATDNEAGSELTGREIEDGGDEAEIPADAFESYQELAATDNEAGSERAGSEVQDGGDEAEIPADAFQSYQELADTANEADTELVGPEVLGGESSNIATGPELTATPADEPTEPLSDDSTAPPSNVIYVNHYVRGDGKRHGVFGPAVDESVPREFGEPWVGDPHGHIVYDENGKKIYHRTIDGNIVTD